MAYLFDDPRMSGTSFYVPRQLLREARDGTLQVAASYMNGSNAWFKQVCTVPAAFNRAVLYDGSVFNAAQVDAPAMLSGDPARGRLTLNGFFSYRKSAS